MTKNSPRRLKRHFLPRLCEKFLSKCSHTACMLRFLEKFFTQSQQKLTFYRLKAQGTELALKQVISGLLIVSGISMSVFAAQPQLSPEEQTKVATACQSILSQPSLDKLSPAEENALALCYQNNSCQNGALADVSDCARKLALWNAKYTAPKIPTVVMPEKTVAPPPPAHPFNFNPTKPGATPPVAPTQAPTIPVAPTEPTAQPPEPTQQPSVQPNQPAKSNINWF